MPAPSCPRIAGNRPSGSATDNVNWSVWQMPVALISTSTSPAFGPSRSTVSMLKGAPAFQATAARVFMGFSPMGYGAARVSVDWFSTAPMSGDRAGRVIQLMNIRRLSESDALQFQALRLAALIDKPEAFVTSHVEEKDLPLTAFEARLVERPGHAVFGAFDADTLVGIAGLARETLLQTRHKGHIWGMYVAAAARGHGAARALLD